MDGSRFDWEMRREDGRKSVELEAAARAPIVEPAEREAVQDTAIVIEDRGGAPMGAWAPMLIGSALAATIAISVSF